MTGLIGMKYKRKSEKLQIWLCMKENKELHKKMETVLNVHKL